MVQVSPLKAELAWKLWQNSLDEDKMPTAETRIYIENPKCIDGVAWCVERQTIDLQGWAIAREGVSHLDVYVDEHFAGKAEYGGARADVAQVFPDWVGAGLSEFRLRLDVGLFRTEQPTIRVELHTMGGSTSQTCIPIRYSAIDAVMFDPKVWSAAFTAHMAPENTPAMLSKLEREFRVARDNDRVNWITRVKAARELLIAAWTGATIDPVLARFLRDLGYYSAGGNLRNH
jgi:hypothetical protein